MAKTQTLSITADTGCPYCKGGRKHSANQRKRCKTQPKISAKPASK